MGKLECGCFVKHPLVAPTSKCCQDKSQADMGPEKTGVKTLLVGGLHEIIHGKC
jgi:hypothetical protein